MPQTVYDATVNLFDFSDLVKYTIDQSPYVYDGLVQQVNAELRAYPSLTVDEAWEQACVRILENNGLNVERNANGGWTSTVFPNTKQVTDVMNPLNSNSTIVKRGNFREMYGSIKQFDGSSQFMQISRYPVSGSLGSKATYVLGSMGSAVAAVSTGIWAGKTFDSALYNAMPDFWNSIGWSSLNPETWGSLTNDSDSPFAGLLNFILGIDGEHGTAQAYMSEDMLAYMAYGLYNAGVFSQAGRYVENTPENFPTDVNAYIPFSISNSMYAKIDSDRYVEEYLWTASSPIVFFGVNDSHKISVGMIPFLTETGTVTVNQVRMVTNKSTGNTSTYNTTATLSAGNDYTFDSKTIYGGITTTQIGTSTTTVITSSGINEIQQLPNVTASSHIAWLAYYNYVEHGGIAGIGTQDGATTPDTTGWDDFNNVLPSLQQQYPDAFQNPMVWNSDSPYDETAGNQTRYIPVPFPFANSATDTQPLSGTQTQTNTSLNTTPQEILDLITKTIQQTDTQPATPPTNPTDTGTGSTPTPTAPTGNASALWSVYHPTQGQVDSFGAWLWGSPFLTNIGKLFQNPIDGVISLHKIFVTPVDSGTGTIVVGTLDSEVPSATVNQQYVYVDCGSINCDEYFGNVFDYSPHTQVSLYLPFIGIVPLDTNDVMRSSINVTYGVDVYTGACLAMVSVSRDGNTVNMYQYAGVASVEYPLSNVQNGQLVSGLLAIGAGVASMVATGGVTTPAVGAVVGGVAASANSNVGKSGGFSGNSGAMGGKVPYLILQRPQTKVADNFVYLNGYPTNVSGKLSDFSGQVTVKHVHVEGIAATDKELIEIESLLKSGILI